MISERSILTAEQQHPVDAAELEFQRLKTVIHEELIESLDLSIVGKVDEEVLSAEIRRLAEEMGRKRDAGAGEESNGTSRLARLFSK